MARNDPKCPRCGSHHLAVDKSGGDGAWVAQCRDCKKKFPYTGQVFFQGEMMTCALCGKRQQSDPNVSSDWRVLQLDGQAFHVCTDHFPPDGAGKESFAVAYETIIKELIGKMTHDA